VTTAGSLVALVALNIFSHRLEFISVAQL
jgi:hypothetical protein